MRLLLLSATVLFVLLAAGCGNPDSELVPVRGQVAYQGRPLTTGNVMFVSEHGPAASGVIGSDGSYALRAVIGTHRVTVVSMPTPSGEDPMISGKVHVAPRSLVPVKYGRVATSGLRVEVKATGENVIDIGLQ